MEYTAHKYILYDYVCIIKAQIGRSISCSNDGPVQRRK